MNKLGGLIVVAVLAAGCTSGGPASAPQAQSQSQEKFFDVAGFGKLKPGMSRQEALATGELAASGAGKTGDCEDFRFQNGPALDPAELAADVEAEEKYAAAQKAAAEAEAKVGPAPGPNAGAADYAAHAERLAASAKAAAEAAQLSVATIDRTVKRAERREANGGVMFGKDKLRMIVAPPGATTEKKIGSGATVEQLKAAYPAIAADGEDAFKLPVPDHQGWDLTFEVKDGRIGAIMLVTKDVKC